MRAFLLAWVCLFLLSSGTAWAQDPVSALDRAERGGGKSGLAGQGPFGLGLILGEPSGLTGKLMLGGPNAVQVHLGYGIGRRGRFVLAADYLFHVQNALPPARNVGLFVPYVGLGARFSVRDDDPLLGVRVPLGVSFQLLAVPVEIFVEVAVGVGLIPSTVALIDGGLGGRFYF